MNPAPFSTDQTAIDELLSCDCTQKITIEMAKEGFAKRKIRIYCDGIYDMFHQGHARQFMQAKNIFPNAETYLIVGVCNDELTHSKKGQTVMTDYERYEAIRHCRYVDEVLCDAPWKITPDFLHEHKIDFVAQDSTPYIDGDEDIYKDVKELKMFVPTKRTEGISTSDIITRILKNYETYVKRNLSRGYSSTELNISYLTVKKFQLESTINSIKLEVINKWNRMKSIFNDNSKKIQLEQSDTPFLSVDEFVVNVN